jgi:hypothetical protein
MQQAATIQPPPLAAMTPVIKSPREPVNDAPFQWKWFFFLTSKILGVDFSGKKKKKKKKKVGGIVASILCCKYNTGIATVCGRQCIDCRSRFNLLNRKEQYLRHESCQITTRMPETQSILLASYY